MPRTKTSQTSICVFCLEPIYYGQPKNWDPETAPTYGIPRSQVIEPSVRWYHESNHMGACERTYAEPL